MEWPAVVARQGRMSAAPRTSSGVGCGNQDTRCELHARISDRPVL